MNGCSEDAAMATTTTVKCSHSNAAVDLDDEETVYTYRGDSRADLPNSFFEFDSAAGSSEVATTTSAATATASSSSCQRQPTATTSTRITPNGVRQSNSNGAGAEDGDFLEMDFDEDLEEEPQLGNQPPALQSQEEQPTSSTQSPPPPPTNQTTTHHDNSTTTATATATTTTTTPIEPPPIATANTTSKLQNYKLNLSSRLVKSNTLPRMGVNTMATTPTVATTPTCSGKSFVTTATTLLKTSGLSYSAPLIVMATTNTHSNSNSGGSSSRRSSGGEHLHSNNNTFSINQIMIWTHEEAEKKSTHQICRSGCGPTAVLNVMTALPTTATPSAVLSTIVTRLRDEDGDLPEYLLSRSHAGTTHLDLIDGINKLSGGEVYCKFFPISSTLKGDGFTSWLLSWMCRGSTPLLTRNLQAQPPACGDPVPDSWHHSMVYGTSTTHIYTTNPLESIEVGVLLPQLSSDSVLLVRREDVCTRMRPRTDLKKLARFSDTRWGDMNVLGHVCNMLLEQPPLYSDSNIQKRTRTAHLKIPASYKPGVTLCLMRDSPYYQDLVNEGGPN